MWISRLGFFPMALDPLVDPRGSCHKIWPPSVMRRLWVFHGGGIGSWELILQIRSKASKKNNFFMKFLDSILLSEKQPWVFLLFGSHMRRVQASNSLGCYFFIEVCRCMNSKFHLDHVALHIFMGYPPFKILPPNGGMCFGRASRKHHQTWQDSKSPTLERHLANQTSATLGIFCGGALVIRWWSMILDMELRMNFPWFFPSKSSSLRDPVWTQRVTGYGTVAGSPYSFRVQPRSSLGPSHVKRIHPW